MPIYKGRTNNWLAWVMVDSTDFATPESALSAATKIKVFGMRRGSTSTSLISSGTGSLTNDIVHIGASVTGQYGIALAKADISSTNAYPWDQYLISLSATGAAYQTIITEGKYDDGSYVSNVLSYLSNMESNASIVLSDIRSNVSDMQSDFQSRVPKAVATNSQLSDLASDLKSYLTVMSGVQSDIYSALSDFQSDFQSRVPKRVATDSQLSDMASDIKSAVTIVQSMASDAASAAQQANSRVLVTQSLVSDVQSALLLTQSLASDAASAAQQGNSRALVNQSSISDIYSVLTSTRAEPSQGAPAATATPLSKIDYLYQALRNKTTQSTSKFKIYADDGTTVNISAAVSDDGTTFTRAELGTGA